MNTHTVLLPTLLAAVLGCTLAACGGGGGGTSTTTAAPVVAEVSTSFDLSATETFLFSSANTLQVRFTPNTSNADIDYITICHVAASGQPDLTNCLSKTPMPTSPQTLNLLVTNDTTALIASLWDYQHPNEPRHIVWQASDGASLDIR